MAATRQEFTITAERDAEESREGSSRGDALVATGVGGDALWRAMIALRSGSTIEQRRRGSKSRRAEDPVFRAAVRILRPHAEDCGQGECSWLAGSSCKSRVWSGIRGNFADCSSELSRIPLRTRLLRTPS